MEVDEVTNTRKRHSSEEIEAQGRSSTSPPKRSTVSTSSTSKSRVSPRPKNAEDALGACSQDSTSAAANLKSAPKYRPQDNGPYAVYVYDLNREKATHPFVISSIIANSGIPDIQEIKKIGKGKILIEAKSATAANRLVDNPTFSKHNLKAFIPAFRVIREGVIQDEPVELELEYIHRHIETPTAKILDIHRLNRRITINGKSEYVPSKTLCIKFAGQALPRDVFLFKIRHEVRPYIPKSCICFSCFRVGHIAKVCKGPPRCLYCGDSDHENEDSCPSRNGETDAVCINCKGSHLATSKDCPIISKQDNIIKLAAVENISIADARRIINNQGSFTRYGSGLDSQDFPRLNSKTPYNSSSSPSFISPNPFNLLEAEDQDYGRISYAEAAGSRPASTTQQASSHNGSSYHHSSHGLTNHLNISQKRVNNPGYDRRAHQEALNNPQAAYGYSNARGMAYQSAPPPPPQRGPGEPNLFEFAKYIPELINLISEIANCFRNHDFSTLVNIIISFIQNYTSSNNYRYPTGDINTPSHRNNHNDYSISYNPTGSQSQDFAYPASNYPHDNFRNWNSSKKF
ncbi:hypothetical protein ALC57_01112 [Trachymyrmex cornetzi]|uniref:CCHC-type domain-containing protein n=1 Tax=Trachymyrmex cornetzi TaxID=471704 RepID=A0A151JQD5_9HYME|nr:hypothetical protein ALC57_01112 [Trachymyrmex cornetzi]